MSELCQRCHKRPATETWGSFALVLHGGGQRWCEECCVRVQLAHAEARAAAIPELRRRLDALQAEGEGGDA